MRASGNFVRGFDVWLFEPVLNDIYGRTNG